MNKQAEYITNSYKIKSVNWITHKILPEEKENPKQTKYPLNLL